MDYSREQGLICASFAVRASLIVKQYERLLRMSPGEPAMDATLTIMSLHAVSTNFQEYQRSLPTGPERLSMARWRRAWVRPSERWSLSRHSATTAEVGSRWSPT